MSDAFGSIEFTGNMSEYKRRGMKLIKKDAREFMTTKRLDDFISKWELQLCAPKIRKEMIRRVKRENTTV